jgi:hypothetical protein
MKCDYTRLNQNSLMSQKRKSDHQVHDYKKGLLYMHVGGGAHTHSFSYTNPSLDLHSKDQHELTSKLIVKPNASQLNWDCPQSPI